MSEQFLVPRRSLRSVMVTFKPFALPINHTRVTFIKKF
jgi:hypothetical protein